MDKKLLDELIIKYHNMVVMYLANGNKQLAFLAKQVEKDLLALRK